MNIWVTPPENSEGHDRFEYCSFEVPLDGLFKFHVWIVSKDALGTVRLRVNDTTVFEGICTEERPQYWRCGSVQLPKGLHAISVVAEHLPERILISEDENIVGTGQAEMLWINRDIDGVFEERNVELTDDQRRMLIRNGFLFDHDRDAKLCEVPSGVPMGGMGAGKIELTPEGFFTAATINNNQDCPIYRIPGSFFAIRAENRNDYTTRLLQTMAVDQLFTPVPSIEADMVFPEARLTHHDPKLPMNVELHAFSAHVPYNIKHSSLPSVFFRFELKNPTKKPTKASLLWSWENLINTGGHMTINNQHESNLLPLVYHTWNHAFAWSNRNTNFQEQLSVLDGTGIHFCAQTDHGNPNSFGEHLIWTPESAVSVLDRDITLDEPAFRDWFENGCKGSFSSSSQGQFRAGALVVEKTIGPGETESIDFVLAWYMPRFLGSSGKDISVHYAKHFRNATEVVEYAWKRRSQLLTETLEPRKALEESSLPSWFIRKLLDCRFVANTNTILAKDEGLFSVNEAPTGMCGCLGTLDQRTCGGTYWTTFYPQLDASELHLLALRQSEAGCPPHDLGHGQFEPNRQNFTWPDLVAAYVIQVHRHFLRTGNSSFLDEHWPHVCKAIEWAIGLDDTGDGMPTLKPGRGTTYDNEQWNGISAFIATMHEASLTIAAALADIKDRKDLRDQWLALAEQSNRTRMKYLWVEEGDCGYFRNAYDIVKEHADDSCFIASLAGDWAMAAAGMKIRLSANVFHQALKSIRHKNIHDSGMTDQSARAEECPAFVQYAIVYFGAAALVGGLYDLAWEYLELQDRIITKPPSSRYNQTLCYTIKGTPSGLPYYMTAPATWLFLDGLSGIIPDVSRQRLQIGSDWLFRGEQTRLPVFLPSCWFMLECYRIAEGFRLDILPIKAVRVFTVKELLVRIPDTIKVRSISVNGSQAIPYTQEDGSYHIPVDFDPGRSKLALAFCS